MSFSIVSLNARGLRDVKRKALFLFSRQFGSDFVFFQESHSKGNNVNFWKSQWGSEIWFSHGSEHSARVSCLKNNFTGDVLHTYCDEYGHFILLILKCYNLNLIVVNYYGYNSRSENDQLLFVLEDKLTYWQSKFPNAYLVIGGDFNTVLNESLDRWPPGRPSDSNAALKAFMLRLELIDIWRVKTKNDRVYTWSNKN